MRVKHERYPPPNGVKRFVDRAVYIAGILGPVMTLPQLWKIWVVKNAAGVSLFSWASFLAAAVIWLVYGILHKDKPIIVNYALWVILEALIVVGVVLYG